VRRLDFSQDSQLFLLLFARFLPVAKDAHLLSHRSLNRAFSSSCLSTFSPVIGGNAKWQ
jgi:hypothetical protein